MNGPVRSQTARKRGHAAITNYGGGLWAGTIFSIYGVVKAKKYRINSLVVATNVYFKQWYMNEGVCSAHNVLVHVVLFSCCGVCRPWILSGPSVYWKRDSCGQGVIPSLWRALRETEGFGWADRVHCAYSGVFGLLKGFTSRQIDLQYLSEALIGIQSPFN